MNTENATIVPSSSTQAEYTYLLPELINQLDVGIIVLDASTNIVLWNKWFEEHSGTLSHEALGKKLETVFSFFSGSRLLTAIHHALQSGMSSFLSPTFNKSVFPLFKRNERGDKLHEIKQLVMIKALPSRTKGFMCVIQVIDVTNADRREKIMREQAKELEQTNTQLSQFAYVASHDLQEPLRTIRCFGDMLISEYSDTLPETGKGQLERIVNSAQRLQVMISDLLTYSNISMHECTMETVNLTEVLHDLTMEMEVRIGELNAQINIGDLPEVQAERSQMYQLFQNLLGNALKFHNEGAQPVIDVYCSDNTDCNNDRVEIIVTDNGIGFNQEFAQKVFDFSERLHNRKKFPGNGIGLAICNRIVERHKGGISAQSKPGEGSTFTVVLPAASLKSVS